MTFLKSPARRAVDLLLELHPHLDVVAVDAQLPTETRDLEGPWLLVTLGQRSADGSPAYAQYPFAIWKATGAIHGMPEGPGGPVSDDPLWQA